MLMAQNMEGDYDMEDDVEDEDLEDN